MRAFEFPLRRALGWRRTQLDLEEDRLRKLATALEEIALEAVRLGLVKGRAEQTVRQASQVEARDLWALAAYRGRLMAELQGLDERKKACQLQVDAQRQKVLAAQRQCRLLEKLEERRHTEWRRESERETENLAAESFLARWHGRGA